MVADCLPRPLEYLQLPESLDGAHGSNRAPAGIPHLIAAQNDLQAIQAWLAEFHDSPQTQRHYRKEAERLLLWAMLEQGKPLSSLSREDCIAYEGFLADPRPRERWCGPRAARFSASWRPFLGPLSPPSRRSAVLVINSLFSYLVEGGYLAGNPLALQRRRVRGGRQSEQSVERFLEHQQWDLILETVESLPRGTERELGHYERVRFLIALLYLLAPRVSEIASHTMGSFVEVRGRWWWNVTGKGQKPARVPVNQDMLQALRRYRQFLGLPPLPAPAETLPLVMSLKGTSGITANMIYRIIKGLLLKTAERLEAIDPHRAATLRRASTHWFRHTSITHQADAGIALRFLQRSARHAKLDTTGLYLHTEEAEWHAAMERHRLKNP